ncbi:MAG: biotin--[acetyl-CoA-carboxylase] ligase [Spirochaetes bacterium]|nr:biotin--[acetyl-CoA-carboxylase] ligase [Spirochaetota bacterium]
MTRNSGKEGRLSALLKELPYDSGTVFWYDSVDSTMDAAFSLEEVEDRSIIVADTQTTGRGRKGRRWYSNEGSLACSVVLTRFDIRVPYSMLASYGVYRAFLKHGGTVALKWINDVLWKNGKKISGVIAEERRGRTVIGIGVNLNNRELSREVEGVATSFLKETGRYLDPQLFLRDMAGELFCILDSTERDGIEAVMGEWEKDSGIRGRYVRVVDGSREYAGRAVGIDRKTGALLLETPAGKIQVFEGSMHYR